jgi:hypothetical protein
MAELSQAVGASSRRCCRWVGTASWPETGGGGRVEALSGSLGGRTSPENGPPWRRELGRWEERRWRGLGISVVGSGSGSSNLSSGCPRWWQLGRSTAEAAGRPNCPSSAWHGRSRSGGPASGRRVGAVEAVFGRRGRGPSCASWLGGVAVARGPRMLWAQHKRTVIFLIYSKEFHKEVTWFD